MRSYVLLLLVITGCAYGVTESIENDAGRPITQHQPPPAELASVPIDAGVDGDACVRQRFAADAIPYGFILDPNCPPDIYAPPRWIPPWDPGPVINPLKQENGN